MNIKRRSFLRMAAASIGAALVGARAVDPPKVSALEEQWRKLAVDVPMSKEVVPRWPTADEMGDPIGHMEEGKLVLNVPMSEELVDDAAWEDPYYQHNSLCQVEVYDVETSKLIAKLRGNTLLKSSRYGRTKWTLTVSEISSKTAIESIHNAYRGGGRVVVSFAADYDTTISLHGIIEALSWMDNFDNDTFSFRVVGIVVEEVEE